MRQSARRAQEKQSDRVLTAIVDSCGSRAECNPLGGIVRFENDVFEGCAFFAHEPPVGTDTPFNHKEMLASRGEPLALWELQVQGRFKARPSATAFVGFELWDAPMELGAVTRAICGTIVLFGKSLAKQRGIEIRCSFGSGKGDRPCLLFPLVGADRIFVSDELVQLPIKGGRDMGVWRMDGSGKWANMDRASLTFSQDQYHTFIFSSSIIDMNAWTVCGVPGIGSLDLEKFWNKQALHVLLCDDGGEDEKRNRVSCRRTFFEMQFHAPIVASAGRISTQTPLSFAEKGVNVANEVPAHYDHWDPATSATLVGRQISPEIALSNHPCFSEFGDDWLTSSEVVREYPDFIRM